MLELAILGLLQEEPMHGYELKRQLTQKLGHFWQVSFGSLYPTLKDLRRRGAIERVFDAQETSRRKNVYRITAAGRQQFLELIEDPASSAWEEEKFPLRFAFFRFATPEIRLRLLERRKAHLQNKLADMRTTLRNRADRIDSYTLSLLRHGMDATAADIEWLDGLIATERRQDTSEAEHTGPRHKTRRRSTPSSGIDAGPTADGGNPGRAGENPGRAETAGGDYGRPVLTDRDQR